MRFREVGCLGEDVWEEPAHIIQVSGGEGGGSLAEPRREEWGGAVAWRDRLIVLRSHDHALHLQELCLQHQIRDGSLRLEFSAGRVLPGTSVAESASGQLFLLVPTTAALYRVPFPKVHTPGATESVLSWLRPELFADPDACREMTWSGSAVTAATALEGSGEAFFAVSFARGAVALSTQGTRLARTLDIQLEPRSLAGRFRRGLFGGGAAEEEAESEWAAVGLAFVRTAGHLRLATLDQHARLRLWSTKDGAEVGSLDVASALFPDAEAGAAAGLDGRLLLRAHASAADGPSLLVVATLDGLTKVGWVRVSESAASLSGVCEGPLGLEYVQDVGCSAEHLFLLAHDSANAVLLHSLPLPATSAQPWTSVPLAAAGLRLSQRAGDEEEGSLEAEIAAKLSAPGTFSLALLGRATDLLGFSAAASGAESGADVVAALKDMLRSAEDWQEVWRVAVQLREEERGILRLLLCPEREMVGLIRRKDLTLVLPFAAEPRVPVFPLSASQSHGLKSLLASGHQLRSLVQAGPDDDRQDSAMVTEFLDTMLGTRTTKKHRRAVLSEAELLEALDELAVGIRPGSGEEMEEGEVVSERPLDLGLGRLGAAFTAGALAEEVGWRCEAVEAVLLHAHRLLAQPQPSVEGAQERSALLSGAWEVARELAFLRRLAAFRLRDQLLLPRLLGSPSALPKLRSAAAEHIDPALVSVGFSTKTRALVLGALELLNPPVALAHILPAFLSGEGEHAALYSFCDEIAQLDNKVEGCEVQPFLRSFLQGMADVGLAEEGGVGAGAHAAAALKAFTAAEEAYDAGLSLPSPQEPFAQDQEVVSRSAWWVGLVQRLMDSPSPISSPALLDPLVRHALGRLPASDAAAATLRVLLFELHLGADQLGQAMEVLSELGEEGARNLCLRKLVVTRLSSDPASLVSMDFASAGEEVVSILQASFRGQPVEAADAYDVLWAIHSRRRELRRAAAWAYELARRLLAEAPGPEGAHRAAEAFARAEQSLAAIPAPEDRYVLRPGEVEGEEAGLVAPIGQAQLRHEAATARIRAAIEAHGWTLQRTASEEEMLETLLSRGALELGTELAGGSGGSLSPRPVLELAVDLWDLSHASLGDAQRQEERALLSLNQGLVERRSCVLGEPVAAWWEVLEGLVQQTSEFWPAHLVHATVARRVLERGRAVPERLLELWRGSDVGEAMATLAEFDHLDDAADLATSVLTAMSGRSNGAGLGLGSGRPGGLGGPSSALLPLGAVELVRRLLDVSLEPQHHSKAQVLQRSLATYLASLPA